MCRMTQRSPRVRRCLCGPNITGPETVTSIPVLWRQNQTLPLWTIEHFALCKTRMSLDQCRSFTAEYFFFKLSTYEMNLLVIMFSSCRDFFSKCWSEWTDL